MGLSICRACSLRKIRYILRRRCGEQTDSVPHDYPQSSYIDKEYRRVKPTVGQYLTCRAVPALRPGIDWPVH